jgi:ribosome-interacting GTPase 1
MPTNLPPDYFQVEKRLREAQTPAEKAALLEELISTVPKHKGTDHLRADLRRQLSRLKEEAQAHKKHGVHHTIYSVEREGAGQAVVVGPANVGKSSLVAALTHAQPEVSEVPYTTRRPAPGMMPFENIQIQLVDTPSMDPVLAEPGLFDLIRRSDLLLLVVDLQEDPLQQLGETLALMEEHRIAPAQFSGKYPAEKRMVCLPAILLTNKFDDPQLDELFDIFCALLDPLWEPIPVSALTGRNFPAFKQKAFELLEIIRVYARPPGKEADLEKPFVMKKGGTVTELAAKIHRDFYEHLKSARVWGSAAFDGQLVQRDYVLRDGDIVELRI